jgi:formylglycine-generating enzyme required for sulfatase activity
MTDGTTGYGSVPYSFQISKFEVTNAQYVEFLNAVAATDTFGLYNPSMESNTRGGIVRAGSPGSFTYAVKTDAIGQGPGGADGDDYTYANKPLGHVSFLDAMRFVNWLENGQPSGAQGASTTEAGVYAINDGLTEARDLSATFFIPSENEWYKAAYYEPDGGYYDYPTATDSPPNNNLPSGDTGNSANFFDGDYATGDGSYPMTDVGAYIMTAGPNGTFDQGGNVWEWNESVISSSDQVVGVVILEKTRVPPFCTRHTGPLASQQMSTLALASESRALLSPSQKASRCWRLLCARASRLAVHDERDAEE